jgi:histidine triad (HIT) family protein
MTIFSKIIKKEIPSDILYENENIIVIKDINPRAKIHILIIPKKEIPTINDIKESDKDLL